MAPRPPRSFAQAAAVSSSSAGQRQQCGFGSQEGEQHGNLSGDVPFSTSDGATVIFSMCACACAR